MQELWERALVALRRQGRGAEQQFLSYADVKTDSVSFKSGRTGEYSRA